LFIFISNPNNDEEKQIKFEIHVLRLLTIWG